MRTCLSLSSAFVGFSSSSDDSSARSSPIMDHHPPEMHILPVSSAHAPGKVAHCFSGLSHVVSLARSTLTSCSPKRKSGAHVFRRLFPKKSIDNRLLSTL